MESCRDTHKGNPSWQWIHKWWRYSDPLLKLEENIFFSLYLSFWTKYWLNSTIVIKNVYLHIDWFHINLTFIVLFDLSQGLMERISLRDVYVNHKFSSNYYLSIVVPPVTQIKTDYKLLFLRSLPITLELKLVQLLKEKTLNPVFCPYLWLIHPGNINLLGAIWALECVRRINRDVVEGVIQGDKPWGAHVELADLLKRLLLEPSRQCAHVQELFAVRWEDLLHLCSCYHDEEKTGERLSCSVEKHHENVQCLLFWQMLSYWVDFFSSVPHTSQAYYANSYLFPFGSSRSIAIFDGPFTSTSSCHRHSNVLRELKGPLHPHISEKAT